MADGDEIRGEVGEDGRGVAVGKDINQRSNTGGGATVHLQGSSDTLSNIFYHLSSINGKIERFGDKLDGHDNRMPALEGRVTRIESGRPIEISNRESLYIVIIVALIALVGYMALNDARGSSAPIIQSVGAVYMFLAATYQNLRTALWI